MLPDPVGSDEQNESITLANATANDVNLAGWKLIDEAGNEQKLAGILSGNHTLSIRRDGSFSLNNNGDTVILRAANGTLVDQVQYGGDQVARGSFIVFD